MSPVGEVRVHVLLGARDDLALGRDDVLGAQVLGERERVARRLRVDDELDDPGAVAQVDEDQPAVVAAAVDPAGDPDLGAARGRRAARRPTRRGRCSRAVAASSRVAPLERARATAAAADSTVSCSPDSMSLSATPSSPRIAT